MGDLFRTLREIFEYLWPLAIVDQWQRAGYYVCGKWWKEMGPGLKFAPPFFTHVETISVVPALVSTGREDITLKDGSTLSFNATATIKVVDVRAALNDIDNFHESTKELIGAFLAEQLAQAKPDRLEPEKRGAFFKSLTAKLAAEAAPFGVEVSNLRFTSFVQNVPMYRLLMEQAENHAW